MLVSSDALHCQQDTARETLCAGGGHLMQIKDNQKKIVRNAKAVVRARRAIEPCKKVEKAHSRLETRKTWVYKLDDPVQLGLFGARTLIMTWRQFEHLSGPRKGGQSKPELVFHASSIRVDDAHRTAFFADAVRKQWAIESKYHTRRDGAYCEDVRTRRCSANVTGALLLARTPTFLFFAESETDNCQEFKEAMQADTDRIFRLVTSRRGRSHLN